MGAVPQIAVAMEELGELISVLSRFVFRGRGTPEDIASEIADVQICVEQFQEVFGGVEFRETVQMIKKQKLERLKNRLSEEKYE